MQCFSYTADELKINCATNDKFMLHSHSEYEIYMFLEGDSKYLVEENVYTLTPGDMIIIRKGEMHRAYQNSNTKYHRIVFMVSPAFFAEKNCPEYEAVFLDNSHTMGNKIGSELVHSSGLYDAIMRMKKYSEDFTSVSTPVTDSIMVEILYILNNISVFTAADFSKSPTKDIIAYINSNFTKDISLDFLADQFYLSKYHICHTFKKATGLTVQNYLKQKRLLYARELHSKGMTLSEAAMASGFKDYSSFYRAYTKKYKAMPKTSGINIR